MSIEELMAMCIEQSFCKVEIYDTDKGDIVWSGLADEIPEEYGEMAIESFDVPTDGCLTFNI